MQSNLASRTLLTLLFSLFVLMGQSQPGKSDAPVRAKMAPSADQHALLWRIESNGLSKPCYLFGTIHLTSRDLFNFSDSLYAALEASDGFAMEVDPDTLVNSMMKDAMQVARQKFLKDLVKKSDLQKIDNKVSKSLGIHADSLTKLQAYLLKMKLSQPKARKDDMPTFVDAYLYGLARDQGKNIAGLEKPEDQINFLEQEADKFDPSELASDDSQSEKYTDYLLKAYKAEDLDQIRIMASDAGDSMEVATLRKRNLVMRHSMDSLFKTGRFFVAVGAAHLPGDSGLIHLLREEGYQVFPVHSQVKIKPGTYVFTHKVERQWVTVDASEEGYKIQMPGKPTDMPVTAGVKLKMYFDLTSQSFFQTGAGPASIDLEGSKRDSLVHEMINRIAENAHSTILSSRIYTDKWLNVECEQYSASADIYFKVKVIFAKRRMYMMIYGIKGKESFSTNDWNKFTQSLVIAKPVSSKPYALLADSTFHFSVRMPANPNFDILPQSNNSGTYGFYSIQDPEKGLYFTITLTQTKPGYFLDIDSVYFGAIIDRLKKTKLVNSVESRDTLVAGCLAKVLKGEYKSGDQLKGLLIRRGNYGYSLLAGGPQDSLNTPDVDSFFSSFRQDQLSEVPWKSQSLDAEGYRVYAPEPLVTAPADDSSTVSASPSRVRTKEWVDTVHQEAFFLYSSAFNPHIYAASDTAFLKQMMYSRMRHPIISYSFFLKQGMPAIRYLAGDSSLSYIVRGAIYLAQDSLYAQSAYVLKERSGNERMNRFFDSLQFFNPHPHQPNTWGDRKALFDSLSSADSANQARAVNALDSSVFGIGDLRALLEEKYAGHWDSLEYGAGWNALDKKVDSLVSPQTLPVLAAFYRSFQRRDTIGARYRLLRQIAGLANTPAMDTLANLMASQMPDNGYGYGTLREIMDSMPLARRLFPRLVQFQQDSILGHELFWYYRRMLDSGAISIGDIQPYESSLLFYGSRYLQKEAKAGSGKEVDDLEDIVNVLARIDDNSTANFFMNNCHSGNLSLEFYSTSALLRLHKEAPQATINALAKSREWRVSLYDTLGVYQKSGLFPTIFLSQHSFAESYVQSAFENEQEDNDEDTVQTIHRIIWIKDGIYTYHGKKSKFILFNVQISGDDHLRLGIAGPFDLKPGEVKLNPSDNISAVDQEHRLNLQKADIQARNYLKQIEKYQNQANQEFTSGEAEGDGN